MKFFKSGNIELVKGCQRYFGIDLPSSVLTKRQDKSVTHYEYAASFALFVLTSGLM